MSDVNGTYMIGSLQRRWRAMGILSHALVALAFAVAATGILHVLLAIPLWYGVLIWMICLALLLLLLKNWKIKNSDVTVYLNKTYPQLEESCGLLYKPQLNLLEQLQVKKVEQALQSLPQLHPVNKRIKKSVLILLGSVIVSSILVTAIKLGQNSLLQHNLSNPVTAVPEKILPGISSVEVQINPPAYTGKAERNQQQFNLQAEEGSTVNWDIKTNVALPQLQLIFNDSLVVPMKPQDETHTKWSITKTVTASGFYQVKLPGNLSDLYRLEVIKDKPPVIKIQSPKPYTVIDFGQPKKVSINAKVSDDYGVKDAMLFATVASGSGEAVKFSEQKMMFPVSFSSKLTGYNLQKTIDLDALKMEPGNELYFYIAATDTHNQQSRSDMYIVSLPDTAELMSVDITLNGLNLKPEYFRSQRQIIIETEQLIKSKDTISENTFKNKSNDLAIDQKLLRLRYGKFLGEEAETNIGDSRMEKDEHHDEHSKKETNKSKDFGNAAEVLDAFTHKHDNAEDATFFDPETKKQLRATLTEMWNAELQLRLFKPVAALPFEYKALRLLKDLQQQSRAYVAKTSVKMPPLKPEKRLTGELDKILSPVNEYSKDDVDDKTIALRNGLGGLEELKANKILSNDASTYLLEAAQQMSAKAVTEPSRYINALQAMRRILSVVQQKQKPVDADIILVQQALQTMAPAASTSPSKSNKMADMDLSKQYFINLKKNQ